MMQQLLPTGMQLLFDIWKTDKGGVYMQTSWPTLTQAVYGCEKCRLCQTRTNVVLGEGDLHAPLMFIGEGPGQQEDLTGRPFVGAAGQLLDKMLAAKNYQAALFILRQLEFGLFDFRLHAEFRPDQGAKILETLAEIKKLVAVVPSPSWGRFPHAFSHIFAGGYAAGYYSYLWADVLAADAFSRFEEEGIFNRETGQSFLDNILSRGGSEEPMDLFKRFRGREPQLDAMLEHYGIKG